MSDYLDEDEEQCICGKEGIKEINIAIHNGSGEQILLGSKCVKRLFDIDVDKRIFLRIKEHKQAQKVKPMIMCILEWAETHPNFQTGYVQSVLQYINDNGRIKQKQYTAINRIIKSWGITINIP